VGRGTKNAHVHRHTPLFRPPSASSRTNFPPPLFSMKVELLGIVPFHEARRMQEALVRARAGGRGKDALLALEHPPTLSLGRRAPRNDPRYRPEVWRGRGIEVVETGRGGDVTFHAPGQLVLYPVISLRERGLGVRSFVKLGLE